MSLNDERVFYINLSNLNESQRVTVERKTQTKLVVSNFAQTLENQSRQQNYSN